VFQTTHAELLQHIDKLSFPLLREKPDDLTFFAPPRGENSLFVGLDENSLMAFVGFGDAPIETDALLSVLPHDNGNRLGEVVQGEGRVLGTVATSVLISSFLSPQTPTATAFHQTNNSYTDLAPTDFTKVNAALRSYQPFGPVTTRRAAPEAASKPAAPTAPSMGCMDRAQAEAILRAIDLSTEAFFRLCLELDIPFALAFILFRPLTESRTGSMIMLRSGADTGCTIVKEGSLFFSRTDNTFTARVSGRFARRTIIKVRENIEILPHVRATGFIGGAGVKFWNINDDKEIYRDNPRFKDIFSCAVHLGWAAKSRASLDMTGKIHHRLLNQTQNTEVQYPTAHIYSAMWNWKHEDNIHVFSRDALFVTHEPDLLRAFTHCRAGCYYTWNQAKGTMNEVHMGRTELGLVVGPDLYQKMRGAIDHGNFVSGRPLAQEHTL
jgi:hypothetical protein